MPATPVVAEVDDDWLSVNIAPHSLVGIRLPAMPYWNRGSRRKRHRYKPRDIKQNRNKKEGSSGVQITFGSSTGHTLRGRGMLSVQGVCKDEQEADDIWQHILNDNSIPKFRLSDE